MRLDDDALLYIFWDAELTFDPASATVVLEVDGVNKAASWTGAATQGTKTLPSGVTIPIWLRTARTDMRFAGSAVTAIAPDVQLAAGRRMAQWLITSSDGQKVPGTEVGIDVK